MHDLQSMQFNYSCDGGTEHVHLSTSVCTEKESAIMINNHQSLQPRNSYGNNTLYYGSTDNAMSMQYSGKTADQMPVQNREAKLTRALPHAAGSKCSSFSTTQSLMMQTINAHSKNQFLIEEVNI